MVAVVASIALDKVSVALARSIFKNMPDEVFYMWIGPLIGEIGWPFLSVQDSNFNTAWRLLFYGKSIQYIAKLSWERCEMPFASIRFEPFSEQRINGLIAGHVRGIDNRLMDIKGGRGRFFKFRELIAVNGRVPAPALLMLNDKDYSILDGNHRIAALASLPNASELMLDCWVGR
jgi:hypothetical protein